MKESTSQRATRKVACVQAASRPPCHPAISPVPTTHTLRVLGTLSLILADAALLSCRESASPQSAAAGEAPGPAPRELAFTDISAESGLVFRHDAGVDGRYTIPEIMGAGCGLFDYDNDGDLDAYLLSSGPFDAPPGSPESSPNRLFRREADGRYTDVSDASGLGDRGCAMGVAVGDCDNDGHLDVFVANYRADALYRNQGDGTFTDVSRHAGIADDRWSVSAAFLDYDRDGHLDLFVVNYLHYPVARSCLDDAGRIEYCGPSSAPPVSDFLYRNRGDGTFEDVSARAGISAVAAPGLGVVVEDYTGDGWPDIYVANDGVANHLWLNNRNGTFTESALTHGAAVNRFGKPEASMGVVAGDIENDGDLDLFMTHMVRESNTLYLADATGGFFDATAQAGLAAPSLAMTGFGTCLLDADHDGDLDLAVANGRIKHAALADGVDRDDPLAAYAERSQFFRNDGRGRFAEASAATGSFGGPARVGRGLAAGDIDNDGDVDLIRTSCNGPAEVLRNDTEKRGRWLMVRAVDSDLRRDAYGARITVHAGGRRILRTVNPGQGYASSCDPRVHVGLGEVDRVDAIEIAWPDGAQERLPGCAVDQSVVIRRSPTLPRGPAQTRPTNVVDAGG